MSGREVTILRCTGLAEEDPFSANDPYVVVLDADDKELYRTPVLEDAKNPVWVNAICNLPRGTSSLTLVVYDQDGTGDEELGRCSVSPGTVPNESMWLQLMREEGPKGRIQIKFDGSDEEPEEESEPAEVEKAPAKESEPKEDGNTTKADEPTTNEAKAEPLAADAELSILRCTGLAEEDPFSANDPFVVVLDADSKELYRTPVLEDAKNPKWTNASCTLKAGTSTVTLVVYDHDTTGDEELGRCVVEPARIKQQGDGKSTRIDLNRDNSIKGGISVSVAAVVAKTESRDEPTTTKEVKAEPLAADAELSILRCTGLAEEDPFSANDPFVVVLDADSKELYRTPVLEDAKNPKWTNASCTLKAGTSSVTLAVYDHDTTGDEELGRFTLTELNTHGESRQRVQQSSGDAKGSCLVKIGPAAATRDAAKDDVKEKEPAPAKKEEEKKPEPAPTPREEQKEEEKPQEEEKSPREKEDSQVVGRPRVATPPRWKEFRNSQREQDKEDALADSAESCAFMAGLGRLLLVADSNAKKTFWPGLHRLRKAAREAGEQRRQASSASSSRPSTVYQRPELGTGLSMLEYIAVRPLMGLHYLRAAGFHNPFDDDVSETPKKRSVAKSPAQHLSRLGKHTIDIDKDGKMVPLFKYEAQPSRLPSVTFDGEWNGIKRLFSAAHVQYYKRKDPPGLSAKFRGLLFLHHAATADFSSRGDGIESLMAARKEFRKYPGLQMLRDVATVVRLLPAEPYPFSACQSRFNKDALRREHAEMMRTSTVEFVRRRREDHGHPDLKKKRVPGATHLGSVIGRIEKKFEKETPKPTVSATRSMLKSLDSFQSRMALEDVEVTSTFSRHPDQSRVRNKYASFSKGFASEMVKEAAKRRPPW